MGNESHWKMQESHVNIRLLIEGCRQGNRNSQRKLYEYFYGYAMNVALRYSKNHLEATEILNEAFLKVFTRLDQYNVEFPFKAWLRKILINTALDYYRSHYQKQSEQLVFSPMLLETEASPAVFPDPVEQDMLPIIQELSPAYRMVFNLYVMEEYKHHEIAALLNISVSTSKSNLMRAKIKLREAILRNRENRKKNHNQ